MLTMALCVITVAPTCLGGCATGAQQCLKCAAVKGAVVW